MGVLEDSVLLCQAAMRVWSSKLRSNQRLLCAVLVEFKAKSPQNPKYVLCTLSFYKHKYAFLAPYQDPRNSYFVVQI